MTLEEAIKHAEEVAEKNEKSAEYMKNKYGEHVAGYGIHCKCAEEHRQLAEWLKELKAVHDEIDDADDGDEIFIGYLRKKMRGE